MRTTAGGQILVLAFAAQLASALGAPIAGAKHQEPHAVAAAGNSLRTTQSSQDADLPTFRSRSELVLVPINVLDEQGREVDTLVAGDFTLRVDGRLVPVASFDRIELGPPARPGVVPPSPALSAPAQAGYPTLVILLVDFSNTSFDDIAYSRLQLLRFLRHDFQPRELIALYGSGGSLMRFQSFTTDREALIAAVDHWIKPRADLQYPEPPVEVAKRPKEGAAHGNTSALATKQPDTAVEKDLGQQALNFSRSASTLAAFRQLARSLERIPGRKLVIWLTAHPFTPFPWKAADVAEPIASVPSTSWQDQANTWELLNEEQMALCPLDVRGVALSSDWNADIAMDDAARATGGWVLRGNNYISRLMDQAQQLWSHYYLLSFRPPAENSNSIVFHHIDVRVGLRGARVLARRGYVSRTPLVLASESRPRDLREAFDSPITVDDLPVGIDISRRDTSRPDRVPFTLKIDASRLALRESAKGATYALSFITTVQDEFGRIVSAHAERGDKPATPTLAKLLRSGPLTYSSYFQLPLGRVGLGKVLIRDEVTDRVGSVSVVLSDR